MSRCGREGKNVRQAQFIGFRQSSTNSGDDDGPKRGKEGKRRLHGERDDKGETKVTVTRHPVYTSICLNGRVGVGASVFVAVTLPIINVTGGRQTSRKNVP